jgi:titin
VAWSAPASDGGDAISSYTASASDGSTTTTCEWTTGSLGCRIEGLDNGTTYSVSVVATNAAGNGSASSSVSATPYTVPGAPSIDTVDAGNGSLTVSWSAPADNGGAVISQYTATATHLSDVHTCQWSTGDLTCSITGLTNGTTYAVVVVATNAAGNSEASVSSDGTPFTVPGAPTITTVTPGDGTLTVSWTVPTTNGGSALTGFTATATNGSETATCTAADTETSCVIDTLTNGTTYSIVVVATNAAGDSVASTSVNAAPYTTPGTPDAPTLTAGNTSIQVDWTAPSDDGGASISGYTVTASDGTTSFTCHWTTGPLSCNITGLTNGTTYSVNVLAINAAGSSSTSDTTDATPLTVPDAPTITGVDRQLDTITVTWSAPLNNGGSAVTAYLVTATPSDSSGDVTCDTTGELTCDLTGVSNTASYSIVVVATNDAGDSAASAASLSSGYSAPAAPTLTAVTAGNAKLTLTFTAGSNGGQDVTDVAYSTDNGATWDTFGSTTGPFVITGLTNGHQYRVRVAQVNVIDQGAASNMMTATPATVPSAPRWLHGVRGNTTATLLWNAPASNGGSAVTGYLVSDRAGHTCAAAASSFTCTVSGLTNGTTYNFYVYAHNVMGDSVASNVNAVIPATTPGAPSIASAVASNKQVLLTVTDPASNGGAALGYYDYSTDNGVNWMSSYGHVSGHLITITGLTNGTTYQVRVRARNVVGAGASSVAVAATPRTIPSAPIIRSVVGVAHGFTVTFTTPSSSGGSPITTYQYSINNGTTWTTRPSGTTSTSFTVTGLVTGRYYQVQVRAVNAAGNSPASAPSRVLVR